MSPLDNPKNTRFSMNYFTSIGLGALTEEMCEHLEHPTICSMSELMCCSLERASPHSGTTPHNVRGRVVFRQFIGHELIL